MYLAPSKVNTIYETVSKRGMKSRSPRLRTRIAITGMTGSSLTGGWEIKTSHTHLKNNIRVADDLQRKLYALVVFKLNVLPSCTSACLYRKS